VPALLRGPFLTSGSRVVLEIRVDLSQGHHEALPFPNLEALSQVGR
jgi:hypothetical protein